VHFDNFQVTFATRRHHRGDIAFFFTDQGARDR
jgi:hypothetical protein